MGCLTFRPKAPIGILIAPYERFENKDEFLSEHDAPRLNGVIV